jgi:thiol-disulfide isomerase/thioredoxin
MRLSRAAIAGALVLLSTLSGGVVFAEAAVNREAPQVERPSENGQGDVSLRSLGGKVVVVHFWATWCEPCKKFMPKLNALGMRHNGAVRIIGVSVDDERDGIAEFAKRFGADFPVVWDKDKAIARSWSPGSLPATFVVDAGGVVRFAHLGYHDGDAATIEDEVSRLLKLASTPHD